MSNTNTNTPSSAAQGATTRPCGPGVCRSNPGCADVYCEGHPVNQVQPGDRDALAIRWFWIAYATCVVALIIHVAVLLARVLA